MKGVLVFLILVLVAAGASADPVIEFYQAGLAAADSSDWEGYLAAMQGALDIVPGQPVLVRRRAEALAQLGRLDEALVDVRRLVRMGIDPDLYQETANLEPLRDTAGWTDLLPDIALSLVPEGEMDLAFELPVDLVPEGIAHDPVDDMFYVSSTAQRKIVRVDRGGRVEDFITSGEHGYLCGLGLAVDAERRRLWAVNDAPAEAGLFADEVVGSSAVHVFDLETGELLWREILAPDAGHSLNDLCLLPDGGAVATGSVSGALLRFATGGGTPVELVPPGGIAGANGICLGPRGRYLYVAKYSLGIVRVELASGSMIYASRSDEFTTCGVDGLYCHASHLIAVQNFLGLDRVAAFALDDDGMISSGEVLVARRPIFDDPTTGAVAGGALLFIADSHVSPFFRREDKSTTTGFGTSSVMKVGLPGG